MKKKKYIVRCKEAGVFFGEVKSRSLTEITMKNVRKLWYWEGACAVEELALHGVKYPQKCKFTVTVEELTLFNPIQIIPCTNDAIKSLEAVHVWQA